MLNVRTSIWETNSSSTHSMVMCMEEDYKKLLAGELMISGYLLDADTFVTREAAMTKLRELYDEDPDRFNDDYDIQSFEEIENDKLLADELLEREEVAYTLETYGGEYMENFEDSFTTPGGETVYAFGYYGQSW